MFGLGWAEIVVIVIVAVVFIRPEDLPTFFRKAGQLYAKAKDAYAEVIAVKDDFLREMDVAAMIEDSEPKAVAANAAPSAAESVQAAGEVVSSSLSDSNSPPQPAIPADDASTSTARA